MLSLPIKMKPRKIKVFIGLVEVAGYFHNLNDGFRESGIKSCFFQYSRNKYYDPGTSAMRFCQFVSAIRQSSRLSNVVFVPLDIFLRLAILSWAIFSFNVFIFASTSTFFRFKELWILKKLGKKIIYVFLGTESRPDYLSGNLINSLYLKDGKVINIDQCIRKIHIKKNTINKIEEFADYCINHPPCAVFQTKPFIKWLYIGFPFPKKGSLEETGGKYCEESSSVKILHAPSNPLTKGTYIFKEMINKLKGEGFDIEFIDLINVPNSKVLELLDQCDFVLDELYSDTPLGGLGTEAAFSGKPTIIAGYYGKYIENDYSKDVIPPSVFCEPEEIIDSVKCLISDPHYRKKSGEDARNFILENWSSKDVASRYLRMINDDVPKEWMGDPYSIDYIFGYGQSKEQLKIIIDAILRESGKNGLAVSDKPVFQNLLLSQC